MNELAQVQGLLARAKGKKDHEKAFRITCLKVMRAVGSYSDFRRLTIPSYFEIVKCLNAEAEMEHEANEEAIKRARRGGR